MRRLIAALALLSVCLTPLGEAVFAQPGSLRVTTPTPTAASLGKFGDLPVSLHTGVPNVSIPLFTAKGRTLELPIRLSYHAGGIRVEEKGGWAGIGWALEAGGTITRTVRGLVDESTNGYYYTGHNLYSAVNWPTPSTTFLANLRDELVDAEPDQFFFDFAGRSGQFAIGPTSTSTSVKDHRTFPQQKLLFTPTIVAGEISQWVALAEDGTKYTFGAVESSTDYNIVGSSDLSPHFGESYNSAWHLTEIRSTAGDVITLQYTAYTVRHTLGFYREKFDHIVTNGGSCVPSQVDVTNDTETDAQRLTTITSAAHTVSFAHTLRTDALSPTGTQQEPRLDVITVSTPGGIVLRKFKFEHDYSTGRLTLKNLYEQDRNNVSLAPYTFTYNATPLPSYSSFAQDFWGYYNGKTSNTTSVPIAISPFGSVLSGADRTADPAFGPAGVLTRITYPTGGYNEFVYENNDYGAVGGGATQPIGEGTLQTASVQSWNNGGTGQFTVGGTQTTIATIFVQQSPTGCAGQDDPPCPYTEISGVGQWQTTGVVYMALAPGVYTLNANDLGTYPTGYAIIDVQWRNRGPVDKKPAGGVRVAEIRTADATGNIGVRKYIYTLQSNPSRSSGAVNAEPAFAYSYNSSACSYFSRGSTSRMPLGNGPAVGYREVTVWHGATGEFGKTRHVFRSPVEAADPAGSWPFARRTDFSWKRGQETGVAETNASGQNQRRTAQTYSFASTSTTKVFRGYSFNTFNAGLYGTSYIIDPFELTSSWAVVDSDTTVTYSDNGASSFTTFSTYLYGNAVHGQLTQQTETNSDGTQRITRLKYPADYSSGSGNPEATAITAMAGDVVHNHSAVVERWVNQKVGATETTLQAALTSFKLYGAGQYLPYQTFVFNNATAVTNFTPSAISGSFTKDSRYLLQETANTYDAQGRITQLTDPRSKVTNYQYGGNINNAFLTKVTRVKDAGLPVDLVTDLAYDTDGFVSSIKDEGGTFKYFTYDLYGRLRQVRNHGNAAVRAFGYTYSRTSGNGWTYQTGSPNAVIDTTFLQHTPSQVTVISTQYLDGLGRPVQSVLKDGTNFHVTATQYDLMGRTWRAWKPYTRASAGYDGSFSTNATSFYNTYLGQSQAKPYVETQYTTDALARVKQVNPEYVGTSPTAFRLYAYGVDAAVKQEYTEITDEASKKTRNYSNVFGAGVKNILGYGAAEATTTNFTVNILGQRTQSSDPRTLNTTYSWNTNGLLTSKTSPDAGTVQQKYDKGTNLRYVQDAKQAAAGQVYFTNYDFANRPLNSGQGTATFSTLDPDAASPPALETTNTNWLIVRTYDAKPNTANFPWTLFSTQITPLTLTNVAGRVAAVASKSNGSWQATLYSYDTDGRVVNRYTYTHGNGGTTVLTAVNLRDTLTWDLRDAVTRRGLTVGASTFNQWYDYDSRGLLWKAYASTTGTKPGTADATFTYRPSGQLQDRQFTGGSLVPIKYSIREQLTQIGDPALTTYPFSAKYSYHPNGTISEAEFYSAGSPATAKRYKYAFGTTSYDALNRLKSADFSSWSGAAWTSTLAHDLVGINYDVAGNLTALQRYRETATLLDNLTYTNATTSNRLNSVTDAVAVTAETWDAETGSFTYDVNGNLATAPAPYSITAVTYDHQNLPTSLTRSGTTTSYRYNEAGQRLTKQVGAGNTEVYLLEGSTNLGVFTVNSGGTVTSSYFTLLAGDKAYGRQPNTGNRKYYHADLLGSTRSVVEGATVVESYDFEPWGLLMPGRTLGSGTKEGFTGKEQDAETGLDYFGARYYLPALGRFGAVDPAAGQLAEWSPYHYTLNNPVGVVDQDGRIPILLVAAALYEAYDLVTGAIDAYQTAKTVASRSASGREKTVAVASTILGGATPLPSKVGRKVVDKVVEVVDKVVDAARGGKKAGKAAEGAVETAQATGRLGGDAALGPAQRGDDFVVTPAGTAVPVSQSRMTDGFDAAGLPRGSTASPGTEYTLPNGMKVRAMEPSSQTPTRRASFENANGGPVTPDGTVPQPPRGATAAERKKYVRERTHVEQRP